MEKITPGLKRRLDMQRYIKENLDSKHYTAVQQYLNDMAEVRGTTVVPTIEQLIDETISPDVLFLSYVYDKVRELIAPKVESTKESPITTKEASNNLDEHSTRQELVGEVRDYLQSNSGNGGWSSIFELIQITQLPQETVAKIISCDPSVPLEVVKQAHSALIKHLESLDETELTTRKFH